MVEKWTTVGRAFERTSPYRIATRSRAPELRATDREEETEVEMRSDYYVRIPKESRHSQGEEGESGSRSSGSYRLPVVTGSRHRCE